MSKSLLDNKFVLKSFQINDALRLILYMNFNHQMKAELYTNTSLMMEFNQDQIVIDTRPKMAKIFESVFKTCFSNFHSIGINYLDYQKLIKNDNFEINLIRYDEIDSPILSINNKDYF